MKRADSSFKSLASAALAVLAGGGLFFAALSSAEAAPTLRLTSSVGGSVTIVDGGAGDDGVAAGVVVFNDSLAGWFVNVSTGVSKPTSGNAGRPSLDLNSVNLSSTGAGGSLTIEFTDTNFSASLDQLNWLASIGGVTDGQISYQLYADEGNRAFERDVLLASIGPFNNGSFSGDQLATTDFGAGNDFSTTLVVTINHNGNRYQSTSFNAVARVPEPGTLALFGIGLAGLGLMRRRRSKVAA